MNKEELIRAWLPVFNQICAQELKQIRDVVELRYFDTTAEEIVGDLVLKEKLTGNPASDMGFMRQILNLIGRPHYICSAPAYAILSFVPKK